MTIIASWEVNNGYVGRSCLMKTTIDISQDYTEQQWIDLSLEDKEAYINAKVQEDFNQRIGFHVVETQEEIQ